MKNPVDYSRYECPYSHLPKECGHELMGPEGYDDAYGVWCACGYRGPVFVLDPEDLGLRLKRPHNSGTGPYDLSKLARELHEQDNRSTSLPIFVVQQKELTTVSEDGDEYRWYTADDYEEVSEDVANDLECQWELHGEEPDGYYRVELRTTWVFVQPFLTMKAAERYMLENGHNLHQPRVHVYSGHQNHEWQAIRKHFMGGKA